MTLREHQSTRAKYVSFANGFPRKEMVPTEEPSSRVHVRGGFFVGLHDDATSCMTKSQKIIPPLAKRRANSVVLKPRASSSRYKNKKDPFSAHKGTEKLGFSPQAIKHNKPKIEKNNQRNESTNSTVLDVKLSRLPVGRPTDNHLPCESESGAMAKPNESRNKSAIFSDVEKQRTLNELIGIDEVYQRVCNGSMNSLSSLVSPVKSKRKLKQVHGGSSSQFIQTSAPLHLKQKPSNKSPLIVGLNPQSKKRNSVLVPLPFFPNPKPPNTAPARLKEAHIYPKIYSSRQEKQRSGVVSSLSGWSSPSIINFNPVVDLPEINKRPVSRVNPPTGSIIGVPNKAQTGKVAIVAALDATLAPPATAESQGFDDGFIEVANRNIDLNSGLPKSPDEDSLYSEGGVAVSTKSDQEDKKTKKHNDENLEAYSNKTNLREQENNKDVKEKALATSFSCMLNVTDESGKINEVEIYDPKSRDFEKEEKINKDIEEAQKNSLKKRQELESLLDEHSTLVQEINQITIELQD